MNGGSTPVLPFFFPTRRRPRKDENGRFLNRHSVQATPAQPETEPGFGSQGVSKADGVVFRRSASLAISVSEGLRVARSMPEI